MSRRENVLLDGVLELPIEKKIQLFADWMMAESDRKLKTTFFVEWMKAERGDKNFLRHIADKAAAVYVTEGFAKRDCAEIEYWLERAIENNKGLTVNVIAHTCKNHFNLTEKMVPMIKKVIRRKKQNKLVRERYWNEAHTDSSRRGRATSTAFKRLLAEGTYPVSVSLDGRGKVDRKRPVVQPPLLDALDGIPSLDSKRRIEDYEALIEPHRSLLGELASMEVLDELLRILYEEGDVPSVVGWRGKTSDSEYMNLREHKHFSEILQRISLYDHTYNVLKAALDIARDDLRQRHDLLLPSVITAALAHDIGKIASLWQSSTIKKHDHESVGAARLEEMLVNYDNEAFRKSVVNAVKLHHAGANDDTVARIVMDAEARAREYEIISSDPTFAVKPMAEWLDLTRFAEIILPAINELTIKNRRTVWKAMSFGGVVYCMPEYIREVLKRLASEKKVLDLRLVRQSFKMDNRTVLGEIAHILKQHDHLAYKIGDGHFGLKFLFQSSIPCMLEKILYAIPVKGDLFPVEFSELEKRKTDYLKTIVSVRPVARGHY